MKILTLDAEFAINEILELSLFAWDSGSPEEPREVMHQFFRPVNERRWPGSERVHHISPKMVAKEAPFHKYRQKIQTLIDAADCLGGFAIENDLAALEREGITGLDKKPYIDVRDLHWLLHGREAGVSLDARKGLAVTAAELGVDFSESDAHGASYDTEKTLECLRILWKEFLERYPMEASQRLEREAPLGGGFGLKAPREGQPATLRPKSPPSGDSELSHYTSLWTQAREEFFEEFAKGWISLIPAAGGYRIKATRNRPDDKDLPLAIPILARQRALNELDAMLDKRRSKTDANVYDLRPADIQRIREYTNEYDHEEQTHRKLHELRVRAYKQLHRL